MIFPVLCFVLIAVWARLGGSGYRRSLILAGLICGALVVLFTESLSPFHRLTHRSLLIVWAAAAIVAGFGATLEYVKRKAAASPGNGLHHADERLTIFTGRGLIVPVVIIILVTGFLGVASAPANVDSMTYHLTRVMYWMQNRSVAHFPALWHAHLFHAPFAEFTILQFMLLDHRDRFAFAVQWMAMLVSILAASLIARMLGAGKRGQILAAVFVATLPAGILQSESTQNNYVPGCWLLCFIVAVLELRAARVSAKWLVPSLMAGVSLGLAVLSKGTTYMVALPLLLWLGIVALAGKRGVRALAAIGAIALFLDLGHYARNLHASGSLLLPASAPHVYHVDRMTSTLWASNAFRHFSLQLWPPSDNLAKQMDALSKRVYARLHLDPDDPLISAGPPFAIMPYAVHEDLSGNPVHLLLILWAAAWFFARMLWRKVRPTPFGIRGPDRDGLASPGLMLFLAGASFCFFCAGLRFMLFNSRLELPIFLIAAAPVAVALSQVNLKWLAAATGWILVGLCVPALIENPLHPLIGRNNIFRTTREQQYFYAGPQFLLPFQQACDLIAHKTRHGTVGMAAHADWEYPFWPMIRSRTGHYPIIQPLTPEIIPPGSKVQDPGKCSAIIVMSPAWLEHYMTDPALSVSLHPIGEVGRSPIAAVLLPYDGSVELSAFAGWQNSSGVLPTEGPYPQLGIVRWLKYPTASVRVWANGAGAFLLSMTGQAWAKNEEMIISTDGKEVGRHRFDTIAKMETIELPIKLPPGVHPITFTFNKFAPGCGNEGNRVAALFSRIQFAPAPRKQARNSSVLAAPYPPSPSAK